MGLATPQWAHAVAAALIFTGVWLVVNTKVPKDPTSRKDTGY